MKIEKITPQILACYCGPEVRFYGASDLWGIYSVGATGAAVLENGIYKGVVHEDNLFVEYDLILRRLESMTEEEAREVYEVFYGIKFSPTKWSAIEWFSKSIEPASATILKDLIGAPAVWLYLLSKGFDLFGLIDAGLAKEITIQTT